MTETEEYFPRGGKKPTVTYFKQSGNFLGGAEKGERKKKKPKKKSEDDDGYLSDDVGRVVDKSSKNCASRLSYKTIKAGVTVLGRVRYAQETKLSVALPGNMTGTVMACHISETYNKQLEAYVNDKIEKIRELPDMFRPGQYVAVQVLEVEGNKLMLTMMPQHVNSGRTHNELFKGDLLQAAVSSIEDHGYVMDIGIPNTRPFLPKSNTNPEIELDLGMVTWCTVTAVTGAAEGSVVALSGELAALQAASPRRRLNQLLPGAPVMFTVDQPLDNGIEGHIFDDTTAYIQRQHADKVKGKKPGLGQKIRARLLYVMPVRNTPFLTMKDIFETTYPDLEEEQKFKEGDIVEEALVLRILGRSVHLKLGQGCVGTMSLKRIQVDEDLADEEVVAKSYPIGSTHRVRVVSYNMADYTYCVSDQSAILDEKYFSLDQLRVGDLLSATVKTVADNHLMVDVGRVSGYIPHTHYTDAGVFVDTKRPHTTKRKHRVGQTIHCRVLVIDRPKRGLLLTAKPSLLDPALDVLKSYEQAEIGKASTGFIRLIREYILVSFFDNVTCLVPRQYVTKEPIDNLNDAFHLGQIVTCTILRVDPESKKMTGSLTTVPFWPQPKRETGKRKQNTDGSDEVPKKKNKQSEVLVGDETQNNKKKKKKQIDDEEETQITETKKKKDKKRKDSEADDEDVEDKTKTKKKTKKTKTKQEESDSDDSDVDTEHTKQKSKKNKSNEEINKVSEESDAIETDIYEDSDQLLTPEDQYLVDLSDCDNIKKCKKRILSLTKNINARTRRIDKIDMKILKIEKRGLSAKNKKFHTAMHTEKLVIQERIKKLLEAVKKAQEKLKELGYDETTDGKDKKEKKNRKESVTEDDAEVEPKEITLDNREVQKETKPKRKKKDFSVVEELKPVLEVPSAKDFWSMEFEAAAKTTQEEESSSSDEEEQEQPKKKRKKLSVAEKLAKVREEEERVRELERRAADDSAPRSSDQFERALLAHPAASQLWIAYMAFHLQSTEIEKARAVGRRALSTIPFREEDEKLNVWIALLNLEHRFGTKESQQKVLEEALQMNEKFKVHSKLLDILVETGSAAELTSLAELMVRKYRREADAYVRCGRACFRLGLVDKARQIMQKAISVLDKKDHVPVLVQFAQLEAGAGQRERGEALLERVVAVYPARVDVVSLLADMMLKAGDHDRVRQFMERMTSQKLPARKMKILYKKWIEVEEKMGDEEKVEEVRQKAMEFIDKAKF